MWNPNKNTVFFEEKLSRILQESSHLYINGHSGTIYDFDLSLQIISKVEYPQFANVFRKIGQFICIGTLDGTVDLFSKEMREPVMRLKCKLTRLK